MTVLTPQQMRELADDFYPEPAPEPSKLFPFSRLGWRAGVALRAGADEVERLRAVAEGAAVKCNRNAQKIEVLETVIENAPHTQWCMDRMEYDKRPCTCWKADAL